MSAQSLADLLKQYMADGAEPPPPPAIICETCGDLGVVSFNVAVDDPRFGKLYPCPNPECEAGLKRQRERVARLMRRSTWTPEYDGWTFDTFRQLFTDGKTGAIVASEYFAWHAGDSFTLHEAAWDWSGGKGWPGLDKAEAKNGLMLTGEHGLGKTGLLVAVTNVLRDRGVPVLFLRLKEMIREVQECYSGDEGKVSADDKIQFFGSVPVLLLDEMALQNYTDDRLEIVEAVIRQRDRDGLPMMGTTNLTLDEFYEAWGGRIADICAKAHWIAVGGAKLRITSRKVVGF